MTKSQIKHFDILEAEKAYREGRNITELLREQRKIDSNSSKIIEIAYDLQAGSYIKNVLNDPTHARAYPLELARILDNHIN